MNFIGLKAATTDQIEAIYRVLLGRPMEPGAWAGTDFQTVVERVASSDEFHQIRTAIESDNAIPARTKLQSSSNLRQSLKELRGVGLEPGETWRSALVALLQGTLEQKVLIEFSDLLEILEEAVDDEISPDRALSEMLVFERTRIDAHGIDEEERFGNERSVLTDIREGVRDASLLIATREHKNVRLELTNGIVSINSSKFSRRLIDFIINGRARHWLFNAHFYSRQRSSAFSSGFVKPWTPIEPPYLDFLLYGDKAGIRPHPLFSGSAYKILNNLPKKTKQCFWHYISEGQFKGYRTSALFDPAYYRQVNSSVLRDRVRLGYHSELEHFCREGEKAGLNFSADFDENYYLSSQPDVADAIQKGGFATGAAHYLESGLFEGRSPNPYFNGSYYMTRYPWIGEECRDLMLAPVEHFLLLGLGRKLKPAQPLAERHVDIVQAKGLYERRATLALQRSRQKQLSFSSSESDTTLLSVIVPVHDQLAFTARFMELAQAACLQVQIELRGNVEIIVVSNGSSDGTNEWLDGIHGITTIKTSEGLGYPRAVNVGAASATGKYLLITNNDIEFEPSCFVELIRTAENDDRVGVIGPMILSMDGTVQEAGSFVGGDGGSFGRMRGELAQYKIGYSQEEVDYVSGCFILLSKVDFETVGGLDEAFSPGYYEEVDLCFRVRSQLEKRVIFDPSILIYHYEHASFMKGRPPAINLPGQLRNRRAFLVKHSEVGSRPPVSHLRSLASLSKLGFRSYRLLIIEDLIPDPRLGSGFGREAQILEVLRSVALPFDILALNPSKRVDEYSFPDVRVYRNWMPGESIYDLLQAPLGKYSHLWVCRTHNLNRYAGILQAYKEKYGAFVVCDTEALSSLRDIEYLKLSHQPISDSDARQLVAAELEHANVADHMIAVSNRDMSSMKSAGLSNVSMITHSVTDLRSGEAPFKQRSRLLLVGAVYVRQSPNYDGAIWFFDKVVPKLDLTGILPTIVGPWDEDLLSEFQSRFDCSACEFTGMIPEQQLGRLYSESRVAVAPTRFSAGVPCKAVEAMLRGTPIVLTKLLAEQLGANEHEWNELAVADHGDGGIAFARSVQGLLSNEDHWLKTRNVQHHFAAARFSSDAFCGQVLSVLDQIGISHQEPM